MMTVIGVTYAIVRAMPPQKFSSMLMLIIGTMMLLLRSGGLKQSGTEGDFLSSLYLRIWIIEHLRPTHVWGDWEGVALHFYFLSACL